MIDIIDTSSLSSLVRYYLPFDPSNAIMDCVKRQIQEHKLIVIDEVLNECKGLSQKMIVKALPFLVDPSFQEISGCPISTENLILGPAQQKKFYHLVNNDYKTPLARNLSPEEFDVVKEVNLSGADFRMIIYGLHCLEGIQLEKVRIVTEETASPNDKKHFQKIPVLCSYWENMETCTLPYLLKDYGLDQFVFNSQPEKL